MEKTTYTKNGDSYTFWNEGNWMFVKHDGKINSIKVIDDSEFVFKLQKTQIRARDGAKGLCEWMAIQIKDDFLLVYVEEILHWAFFRKIKEA